MARKPLPVNSLWSRAANPRLNRPALPATLRFRAFSLPLGCHGRLVRPCFRPHWQQAASGTRRRKSETALGSAARPLMVRFYATHACREPPLAPCTYATLILRNHVIASGMTNELDFMDVWYPNEGQPPIIESLGFAGCHAVCGELIGGQNDPANRARCRATRAVPFAPLGLGGCFCGFPRGLHPWLTSGAPLGLPRPLPSGRGSDRVKSTAGLAPSRDERPTGRSAATRGRQRPTGASAATRSRRRPVPARRERSAATCGCGEQPP